MNQWEKPNASHSCTSKAHRCCSTTHGMRVARKLLPRPALRRLSWSVAEAQGYRDGELIPIALAEEIVGQIAATIDLPVSVDFEGGYNGDNDDELAGNIARLLDLGVIGINHRVAKGS